MTPKAFLHCRMTSCSRHTRNRIAKPGCRRLAGLWVEARAADGNGGVSQRIEYGSVGCVLPVASKGLSPSCRTGIVFGGDRRFGLPGFCKVPPRSLSAHHGGTSAAMLCITTPSRIIMPSVGTTPTGTIATSRAVRAGTPAWRKCRRAALPTAMPALPRALSAPAARPRRADSVRRTSSPKRAAYLGGNPTGRGSLWCARFMNMVLQREGYRGTGSDMARSFASYGQRVSGPQIGAIAVMSRRGGGHVDASGSSAASTRRATRS